MKEIIFCVILMTIFNLNAEAQLSKVTSCYNYLKYGEIDKAKEAIDQAAVHEKSREKSKTWYFYGKTYHAINDSCMYSKSSSVKNRFCSMDPDALKKTFDAYTKAWILNFKEEQYHTLDVKNNKEDADTFFKLIKNPEIKYSDMEIRQNLEILMASLTNSFVNKGLVEYQDNNDFSKAVVFFETGVFLSNLKSILDVKRGKPYSLDTAIIHYTALSAEKAKEYEKARTLYEQLTKMKYGDTNKKKALFYLSWANIYKMEGNNEKYVETLKKGIEAYPDGGIELMNSLINYYLEVNQSQKALDYLELAIEKNPGNANYYTVKGSTLERAKLEKEAEEAYKKAIELKPDYTDALMNLGIMYFNQAADIHSKAQEIKDNKKYKEMLEKRDVLFNKALPLLEKSHELDSSDKNVMISLKQIYVRLQMMDKYEEMKKKLGE